MPRLDLTTKRVQINKANLTVVVTVSVAAFVTIFALVAVKTLWTQRSYQSRVITARETARDQLKTNIDTADKLTTAYKGFVGATVNVIGGSSTGNGERDGDNARIILDALPSKYDFPALATSLEKLTNSQGLAIESIVGVDDELNQSVAEESPTPQAVEMPFKLVVKGNYASTQELIGVFERSIRPFVMNELILSANDGGTVQMTMDAKSYYQPEKSLQFKKEVIQ